MNSINPKKTSIMKLKSILLIIVTFFFLSLKAQYFELGKPIKISNQELKLIKGFAKNKTPYYRYIKPINLDLFDREIADIIVGVEKGEIVAVIYNLVPLINDNTVPSSIVEYVQSSLPTPLKRFNDTWVNETEFTTLILKRETSNETFGSDRIIYNVKIKN
jgi:hypothetical protein